MFPGFNHSHVLPPFVGETPRQAATTSPYETTARELVARLGGTPPRAALLRGLFAYRQALRELGFSRGFQWIDGSFVEDIEAHAERAPNDIDVVSFAHTPAGLDAAAVNALVQAHPEVFVLEQARRHYGCDAYVVRLDGDPVRLVRRATYYHGLFSHRRSDNLWKGLLLLPLASDDEAALAALNPATEGA